MALIIAGQTTISIDTVYQRVLALANKEQRGYITPQEFNLHANQAQLDIFEQYFYDLAAMINLSKRAEAPQTSPGANNALEPDFGDAVNILREKISIYNQFAQELLGDKTLQFSAPFSSKTDSDKMDEVLFLNFKRLFVRDGIKRETFAMRVYRSGTSATSNEDGTVGLLGESNLFKNSTSGSVILTDVGAASSIERSNTGGDVGNIVKTLQRHSVLCFITKALLY